MDLKNYTRSDLEEDMANCEEILKDFLEDNQSKITEIRSKLENQKHYGYVTFLDELNEITNPEKTVWKGIHNAKVKTPGGHIWNVTRVVANAMNAITTGKININNDKNAVASWNKVFRLLHYDGVVDIDGSIIHSNEPTQAVFFSVKSFTVLETIRNIKPVPPKSITLVAIEKPELFLKWLYAGKLDLSQISHILFQLIRSVKIDWDKLPDYVKRGFTIGYKHWISRTPFLLDVIPLTDDQVITLLQKHPKLINYLPKKLYTSTMLEYACDNFNTLSKYINDYRRLHFIPFTQEQMLRIFKNANAMVGGELLNYSLSDDNWDIVAKKFLSLNPEKYGTFLWYAGKRD